MFIAFLTLGGNIFEAFWGFGVLFWRVPFWTHPWRSFCEPSGGHFGRLGLPWAPLGSLLGTLWDPLAPPWAPLESLWGPLGPLGPLWRAFGRLLGPFGSFLGAPGSFSGNFWLTCCAFCTQWELLVTFGSFFQTIGSSGNYLFQSFFSPTVLKFNALPAPLLRQVDTLFIANP